jgi:hypothetical protein
MVTVSAAIGLHLELKRLLSAGFRALMVGGAASLWMASLSLAMVALAARGAASGAALVGVAALASSAIAYRVRTSKDREARALRVRFDAGAPLSMREATRLLDDLEARGEWTTADDATRRRVVAQIHPAIGELIPIRESPLPHGEGCRWMTYWEGKTGWALVAMSRDPKSFTPIHAHPHRLIGKSIEGLMEELRFEERGHGALELVSRRVLAHNDLVETDALATVHLVRVVGESAAIDLQLRGPEIGEPGKRFRAEANVDVLAMKVGEKVVANVDVDDRPGHAGEGARAGRPATPPLVG